MILFCTIRDCIDRECEHLFGIVMFWPIQTLRRGELMNLASTHILNIIKQRSAQIRNKTEKL